MKKNIRVIKMLLQKKLSHMMVFRFNFFSTVLIDGVLFFIQLLMFSAIYSQVDTIGGWERGQMIIFIGTFSIINAINMVVFFFGLRDIPQKIKEGSMDYYLTKPVNPLIWTTFENIDIGSLPLIPLGIAVVAYGVSVQGIQISLIQVAGYIVMILLMTLLWYDLSLIFRSFSFFFISVSALNSLEDSMIEMNFQIPGVLYKGVFKVLFWLVLPYGLMATIPTQLLAGIISGTEIIYAVGVVAGFTIIALSLWKLGIRNYKSASS